MPEVIAGQGGLHEQLGQIARQIAIIGTEVGALARRVDAMERRRRKQ